MPHPDGVRGSAARSGERPVNGAGKCPKREMPDSGESRALSQTYFTVLRLLPALLSGQRSLEEACGEAALAVARSSMLPSQSSWGPLPQDQRPLLAEILINSCRLHASVSVVSQIVLDVLRNPSARSFDPESPLQEASCELAQQGHATFRTRRQVREVALCEFWTANRGMKSEKIRSFPLEILYDQFGFRTATSASADQRAGVAMLTTIDEHAAPMVDRCFLFLDNDPCIYFLTHQNSKKGEPDHSAAPSRPDHEQHSLLPRGNRHSRGDARPKAHSAAVASHVSRVVP